MTSSAVMHRILLPSIVGVVILTLAAPAYAQSPRPERPYRGLFRSGVGDVEQMLDAQASIGSGYDDDLVAEATGTQGTSGVNERLGGGLHAASGQLGFRLNSAKVAFSASGGTAVRYYPSLEQQFLRSSHGQVATSLQVRERTTLSASMAAVLQPYSFGLVFPTLSGPAAVESPAPELDQAVTIGTYVSLDGQARVSQQVSRRVSLSGNYAYRVADLPGDDVGRFTHHNAVGQLAYSVGKGLALRAGYGYGESRYDTLRAPVIYHSIDAGVDFNRALSFSRRTTLAFGTGTAAARVEDTTHYVLVGNATLNHEIGRSWRASAGYGRGVQFFEAWPEPVLSDAATVSIGGLLTRRLELLFLGNAARGTFFTDESSSFTTYYGRAEIQYAATRFMRLGALYAYYHHDYDGARQFVAAGVASLLNRQSFRASVTFWAPLFQRARRIDATG